MGKITLTLNDEIEKRFREEVFKRLGMKKGNIQQAIEDAIEVWIKTNRNQGAGQKRKQ
jgi:hypothetical protein